MLIIISGVSTVIRNVLKNVMKGFVSLFNQIILYFNKIF